MHISFVLLSFLNINIIKAQYNYSIVKQSKLIEEKIWFYRKVIEITNCGVNTDSFQFNNLLIEPNPPLKNKDLNIKVMGKVIKIIERGDLDVNIKLGAITLINKKYQFCSQIEEFNDKCPISLGEKVYTKSFTLPNVPSGIYNIKLYGPNILCLNIHIRIV